MTNIRSSVSGVALAGALALTCMVSVVSAQENAASNDAVVEAIDIKEVYGRAEALRKGKDVPKDVSASIPLYAQLADAGHAPSMSRLGDIYYYGRAGETDLDQAIGYYRAAVDAGRDKALLSLARAQLRADQDEAALDSYSAAIAAGISGAERRLAIGHAKSRFGGRSDPELGFELLQKISTEGDESAKFELGEAYRYGRGTEKNLEKSYAVFSELAEDGNLRAIERIGFFQTRGIGTDADSDAGLTSYQAAVDGGREKALIGLAKAQISAGDFEDARLNLEKAVELGVKDSELELAEAHYEEDFREFSDPGFGRETLVQRAEQGDRDFAIAVVKYLSEGDEFDINLTPAIEIMMSETREGDNWAAEALARLYRKRPDLVENSKQVRSDFLEEYGSVMRPRAAIPERLYLTYETSGPVAARPKLWELLKDADPEGFYFGLRKLFFMDRNAYTYSLQSALKDADLYSGRANGRLNRRTLLAVLAYCKAEGFFEECQHGPLRTRPVELIAKRMSETR